jgi:formate C-acetyltransferase
MNEAYKSRLLNLRKAKLEQTQEKLRYEGYLDEDDYGRLVPTFEWRIIPNDPDGNFYGIDGWTDNFCDLMDKHDIFIVPDDAFTGRWMYFMSKMRPSQYKENLLPGDLKKDIGHYCIDAGIGFEAHFCPDYRIGLDLGWDGLIAKLLEYKEKNKAGDKAHFYDCHVRVIRAVQGWIKKHIAGLDALIAAEADPYVKQEFEEKKRVNGKILGGKPETLREALQWIIWFHLASRTFNRDGAGGQLDTLLMPYYERDLEKGIIDRDRAVYYIGCFLLNDPAYWQLGGPDPAGEDQSCEMSWIILDAADIINVSLNLTIRVHDKMDLRLLDRGVELLVRHKEAWPRFSGDKALVEGFCRLGYSPELARKRIAVGCNWMAIPGMEYTVNDLFKVNMARVFELAWEDMMSRCGYPGLKGGIGSYVPVVKGKGNVKNYETPSTQFLWRIFLDHLERAVKITARAIRFHLSIQSQNEVELLLNLLCYGPVEKGLDISAGAATYYNLAIDGAGIGTAADSFAALEQRIEIENRVSWEAVNTQIRTSWAAGGGEDIRLMMKASERYGSGGAGDKWAKAIAGEFSRMVVSEGDEKQKFIPGLFSWAKPHLFGKAVGATPDGRRFGDPITHGANPAPCFTDEPTVLAQASAVASVQCGYGNTAPLQLEFDPFSLSDAPVEIVKALILAHFDMGGTLININVFNKEKLLAAHEDPQKYPDLVVRVTGFTAYFCMLTPEFRQLVIDRILQAA